MTFEDTIDWPAFIAGSAMQRQRAEQREQEAADKAAGKTPKRRVNDDEPEEAKD